MNRRTPLYEVHRRLGAKLVEFGGWDMPVSYQGPAEEHRLVRERCGLFDVSHMGEIEIEGPGALALCQRLTVNDVARLQVGQGQYSVCCSDDGGIIDDLIVFRMAPEGFLLIVNASNTATDLAWIRQHADPTVRVTDRSQDMALLAVQGPASDAVLQPLTPAGLEALPAFARVVTTVDERAVTVFRTGYTGERGVEILCAAADAGCVWESVLAQAQALGGGPAGLAARDTLRLEAGLPLYGNDLDRGTSPLEAGLGWVVKPKKGDFIGRAALERQQAAGLTRRLVGLQLDEAGIARHGFRVLRDGIPVGAVTSGAKSPTLGTFIAMAYVASHATEPHTRLAVEIRGRQIPAHVVPRPFYRRGHQE